ncbi:MAG TPA: DNA cytosine methyltransferase [Hyphomicrobium sp.]|nr:DNA cytosine methyltransferase [Hyphomicrobium sp.]
MLRYEQREHTTEGYASTANRSLRAVSLFCGAGGFCEGVRLAGFQIAAAVEADPDACKTHSANFPGVSLFSGDIAGFLRKRCPSSASEIEATCAPIDLVFGGPPCQGFSQIGPRDPDDPRNQLYRQFLRVVRRLKPAAFIMENLPNMLSLNGGQFRDSILRACRSAGYGRTTIMSTLASDFGVPQDRRRIFIVGLCDELEIDTTLEALCLPRLAEFKCAKPVTVWQAISDLPADVSLDDRPVEYPSRRQGQPPAYQRLMRLDYDGPLLAAGAKLAQLGGPAMLYNHHTKGMEERRRTIVGLIQPGMTGANLPKQLWKGIRGHKWRRLSPDKPSYTILAQMSRDLSEWIHPVENRWITVREAARLQSFHDGFVFHGSEYQQLKQVGNAVPPLLGLAIASAVKSVLRSVRKS